MTTMFSNDQRQKHFPGNAHQLVIAESRQCRTQPDVEEEEQNRLDEEPEIPNPNTDPSPVRSVPPRKSVLAKSEITIIEMYSPRK